MNNSQYTVDMHSHSIGRKIGRRLLLPTYYLAITTRNLTLSTTLSNCHCIVKVRDWVVPEGQFVAVFPASKQLLSFLQPRTLWQPLIKYNHIEMN